MSKWTIEKINAQIKRGDTFSFNTLDKETVLKVDGIEIIFYNSKQDSCEHLYLAGSDLKIRFYRFGVEILPEPERELIKFTEKLIGSSIYYLSDSNEVIQLLHNERRLTIPFGEYSIEEIPNARVLYRYADTLEIARWGNDS